jgi:hypothetical protein
MKLSRLMTILMLALCVSTYGCGDSDDDDDDAASGEGAGDGDGDHGDGDGDAPMCGLQDNCTDTVDFEHGLTVDGDHFSVEIVSGDAPDSTMYSWMVNITDADGNEVDDATVTVSTYSVDCGHGGPADDVEVMANDDGMYHVASHTAHGGPWDTVLEIEAGDDTEVIAIRLCVDAPGHGEDGAMDHDDPAGDEDAGMAHDEHAEE